ncbi:Oligopeptide transporter 5 [Acorus gramineus]|uniref:Oligopeptide transporter 5 n=1 Tax=Acorus gramineus TaxID=55184 RepID=A0AAV9BAQ7_ACOGR|nr:Oligopeptide transporter 5 [Acorus gramineus]
MEKVSDEIEESPIEEVRLTIPITDDNTLPTLTFRTWVLGISSCLFLAFALQILAFRQNFIFISTTCIQILVLPLGKLMARVLPTEPVRIPLTKWKFSLNPGPFNMKEHALIYTLTNAGFTYPAGLEIITQLKVFYHRKINYLVTFLIVQATQFLGFGFAGLFMKFLVDSPNMWYPTIVAQYSLFRAMHEKENRMKGSLTSFQFFLIAAISSFAYYIVPNYLFPSIGALSLICWIWRDSVTAQIIGSGRNGLGIGSFTLDWTVISSFMGNPLVMPVFTLVNSMAGFILIAYIITPVAYWTNSYNAKRFPIFSVSVYDKDGHRYNVSRIINEDKFVFDQTAYDDYSKIYFSAYNIVGTLISTTLQFFMQWYILSSVKNICEPDKLPKGSQWTCPSERLRFMNNVIWGLVGPAQVFFPSGQYSKVFISFFIGSMATIIVWFLARRFPDKKWIKLINIPIILSGAIGIPPSTAVNYWSWFTVGILFNYVVYRRYKGWWAKYNYVLSNALDAGCAFMALLITAMLQLPSGLYGIDWWGLDTGDHCPLASCPTAPGVVVDGCPITS